jgi:hypothetical protein
VFGVLVCVECVYYVLDAEFSGDALPLRPLRQAAELANGAGQGQSIFFFKRTSPIKIKGETNKREKDEIQHFCHRAGNSNLKFKIWEGKCSF